MNGRHNGLILAARYGRPPNLLHYCGPDRQQDLDAYLRTRTSDAGLAEILQDFETLYPYLTLIAGANNISDPFDRRVVEAYFIGNDLLQAVSLRSYDIFLDDELMLKKKLTGYDRQILSDTFARALPHHTYHVLSIFRRTGHASLPHTLETMNQCRIAWGMVKTIKNGYLTVSSRQLALNGENLLLSPPVELQVRNDLTEVSAGCFVSFHWQQVCSKLTRAQTARLAHVTGCAIDVFNSRYDHLSDRKRTISV